MTQTRLLTADDLFAMGSDCHCELVDGRLVEMSPTGFIHGAVTGSATILVGRFVREHQLGWCCGAETGFRLRSDPDLVRAPDFAFVAEGRVTPEMDTSRYLNLAPDFVIEVVSPGDRASEIAGKVLEYLQTGVRLVWVAYPELQAITVHRPDGSSRTLRADDILSGEDVLPGFTCRVAELFPAP
ncbi:MAG: Uma2 family endonuclease [Dehalococcoidia bacterium]